ncbi:MAG: thioredoxin [Burkholderiales bacterium]|jgi:thioredoxin 1
MATVEITKENFEDVVNNNDMVVIDFWASWCGPCKTFAPIFDSASEKYTNVVFGKVNTEEQMELAGHFQIRSIPTLMVVREKVILYSRPGAVPAQALDTLMDKMLAVDMAQVRQEIASAEAEQSET